MKISGTIVEALAKAEVPIPRTNGKDIVVVVRALRLAEENEAEKLFPDIEPARGYLKDDKGMPLRNPDTGEVVHGPLLDDPGYVTRQQHAEDMRTIVKIVICLDGDERITWETEKPKSSVAYYEDIRLELSTAGFSYGDLAIIVRKANELANMDIGVIERAAQAFSSREQTKAQTSAQ